MSADLVLPAKPQAKRPAGDLVVATRMPKFPEKHTGDPFTTVGDIVADCDVEGCGWHAQGERAAVGAAIREHHRLFHSESTSVVMLNHARQ